jgi:hypothetical protein
VFDSIPIELRRLRQWVVWRYEPRDGAKDTKVPYCAKTQRKAAVDRPDTWCSFEEAVACYQQHGGQTDSTMPGVAGIGLVLTETDPFGVIDLDDTHGDEAAYERQVKIYKEFDTYSELSPSGKGVHIWVKGHVPHGRKRAFVEVYSAERFMTMTGKVTNAKEVAERHDLLNLLWSEMGGPAATYVYGETQEQKHDDDEVISLARNAANGDKFERLFVGNYQNEYHSQSEADQALMNILAYYTQNRAQLMRLFRQSELGQRDKAQRDRYLDYTINKAFDRNLPPLDIEGLLIAFKNMVAEKPGQVFVNTEPVTNLAELPEAARGAGEPGGMPAPHSLGGHASEAAASGAAPQSQGVTSGASPLASSPFPPGLVGEVAQFIYDAAPRPVPEIALAGAIGFLAGILGRSYNVSGTGLNQYVLLLAPTGSGKEAIANGTDKLIEAVKSQVPSASEFVGPGELVSSAGLIKWLAAKPAVYTIVGEFGLKLAEMSSAKANPHLSSLKRVLLDLYHKSGMGNVLQPMAYSDKEKNTQQIYSPALTLIGESTPERFYEVLDEAMVSEGLLPRFTIIEYLGKRPPRIDLVERLGSLIAQSLTLAHNRQVHHVAMTDGAHGIFDAFDKWCDRCMNDDNTNEVVRQLWNRAHLKAMKLAALIAVGINYINPMIDENCAQWATDQIASQTSKLIAKFRAGDIGDGAGNESRQVREVIKTIATYLNEPFERYAQYGGTQAMHAAGIIRYDHIQRRLVSMAMFRQDRIGGTNAIKRAIDLLLTADELREVPRVQMTELFGSSPRAFMVSAPARFRL